MNEQTVWWKDKVTTDCIHIRVELKCEIVENVFSQMNFGSTHENKIFLEKKIKKFEFEFYKGFFKN